MGSIYMLITAVLLIVLFIVQNYMVENTIPKYRKAIGVPEKKVDYLDAVKEADELLSIIDQDVMKRRENDIIRSGPEFKFYMDEARKNSTGLSLVVYLAHMTGCEVVLRKVSEEDIEAENNRGAVFLKHYNNLKGDFDDNRVFEYSIVLKYKKK